MNTQNKLIWIDLEMTGLDPANNVIIEIATIVTDSQLNEIATGPVYAIYQPKEELDKMDDWNINQHGKSGLIDRVKKSSIDTSHAEQKTIEFLQKHLKANQSPMCGNSICMDRRFLAIHMPKLESFFHYRNLDVSSLKIIKNMWYPNIKNTHQKSSEHLALSDIKDSIDELKFYRDNILIPISN